MADEAFSLIQLAAIILLVYLLVRFFRPTSPGASSSASSVSGSRNPVEQYRAQIETLSGMFPQHTRREILWDLQANRGNVGQTTERILGGRGLDIVGLARLHSVFPW